MPDLSKLFIRLSRSKFRSRFHLDPADSDYFARKGLDSMQVHASDFIRNRLAPAHPAKDGKQTPWRGHPVFVAQHATATCCRGCLEKWHAIPKGREMSAEEQGYVVGVIQRWLALEAERLDITPSRPRDR